MKKLIIVIIFFKILFTSNFYGKESEVVIVKDFKNFKDKITGFLFIDEDNLALNIIHNNSFFSNKPSNKNVIYNISNDKIVKEYVDLTNFESTFDCLNNIFLTIKGLMYTNLDIITKNNNFEPIKTYTNIGLEGYNTINYIFHWDFLSNNNQIIYQAYNIDSNIINSKTKLNFNDNFEKISINKYNLDLKKHLIFLNNSYLIDYNNGIFLYIIQKTNENENDHIFIYNEKNNSKNEIKNSEYLIKDKSILLTKDRVKPKIKIIDDNNILFLDKTNKNEYYDSMYNNFDVLCNYNIKSNQISKINFGINYKVIINGLLYNMKSKILAISYSRGVTNNSKLILVKLKY
jgi:hypothetical protein